MRQCARCERETNGALLCKTHQREALRKIRQDAIEREQMLREEDDAEEQQT